ncbi:MAG: GTP-binding protein [Promethearchaeota archaeon]
MPQTREQLFKDLFTRFLEINKEVFAIIVSDYDGLIIAGEKTSSVDMEIISVLTAIINPILERIRNEFAFKKFGTASFDTDDYRLLFIAVDEKTTLSVVLNHMASIDRISPYAYFVAEKTAQIMGSEYGDFIQLTLPNFEIEAEKQDRLKNQVYQMRLDSGGQYRFKFIIIGDHEVGKTSIVRRFVEKKFSRDYRATIGLNILTHKFSFVGNEISVSLWDVGAQNFFKRFRKSYYMGAQAAFIVYDLTNRESYEGVISWFEELNTFIGKADLPIVVVGNKSDLKDHRVSSYQEGVEMASKIAERGVKNASYIETSALTGENIEDAFSLISYHYIMKSKEIEELELKKDLLDDIKAILESKQHLTLAFYTKSPFWSPGLQILVEIKDLGKFEEIDCEKDEKIYQFQNGLTLKNYTFNKLDNDIGDVDGVFCIFDARDKERIDPEWKKFVIKIIEIIQENKVILIGVRVSETLDWSKLLMDFDVNEQLEKKMVSLLIFKIGEEYRLEIHDQLKVMLNTLRNII